MKNTIRDLQQYLSVKDIQEALKVSKQTVYNYRNCNKSLSVDQLIAIKKYLKNRYDKFDSYLKEQILKEVR